MLLLSAESVLLEISGCRSLSSLCGLDLGLFWRWGLPCKIVSQWKGPLVGRISEDSLIEHQMYRIEKKQNLTFLELRWSISLMQGKLWSVPAVLSRSHREQLKETCLSPAAAGKATASFLSFTPYLSPPTHTPSSVSFTESPSCKCVNQTTP